jgi:hypothetical protein
MKHTLEVTRTKWEMLEQSVMGKPIMQHVIVHLCTPHPRICWFGCLPSRLSFFKYFTVMVKETLCSSIVPDTKTPYRRDYHDLKHCVPY